MELVSTAKLKRNKDRLDITKPYFETVKETVQEILSSEKSLKHDYLSERVVRKTLYIVITSDRGLCGGYNANAIKQVTDVVPSDKKHTYDIFAIGKKAHDFFTSRNYNLSDSVLHISEKPSFLDAQNIARKALKMYKNEEVDAIKLVYTRLVSTISQEAATLNLLPIEKGEGHVDQDEFVTYEPSPEVVLDFLIPKYIESTIFGALTESAASEQAARRMAMENASDNAEDMIDELNLSYNKARQAAITQEISEIVGGAEALK
jgi:F-type H+-transporting ATPase subunit gamma